MNQLTRSCLSITSSLLIVFTAVPAAWAHAHPKTMVPPPDSVVPAPRKISITFSEAVEPKFSSIKLTDLDGNSADPESSSSVAGDPTTIVLAVPSLAAGTYVVHWVNVSVDGHRLDGSYRFTVR
jgi:copper resistance protein C